jgi:hypothetical protein
VAQADAGALPPTPRRRGLFGDSGARARRDPARRHASRRPDGAALAAVALIAAKRTALSSSLANSRTPVAGFGAGASLA